MADNTLLNIGTGGDTIRDLARQAGTVKTQVVQLDFGGASSNAESLHSTTNALPAAMYDSASVGINSLSAGTGANGLLTAQGATNFFVSTVNSSTTQLAAAATFNGTIESVLSAPYASIIIDTDQTGTLVVKQYITSSSTTQIINTTFNIPAKASGSCFGRSFPINGNFFSVSYTNTGGAATTTLNINVAYGNIDATTQLLNLPVSLNEVNGSALSLGQVAMASSLPVVLASNQSSIPVAATLQAGSAVAGKFGIDQTTPGTTNLVALTAETTKVIGTVNVSAAQTISTTQLPTAAASADALTNPTISQLGADNMVFNGTTWDRQRGMSVATTTGDTGAKTATGNGATQTNIGNKGIQVVLAMGAVTGTSPTFVMKLQSSVDGGTNWVDMPGATTASLVATGVWGISVYPGQAVTAGTTTTGTTATANGVLSRTWRVVWTIGGTTPSFTITSITYNYLPN